MTEPTKVEFQTLESGVALKIEQPPQGPLIVIEQDGTIKVTRGPFDEAGKMFWDAVHIHGKTYRERVAELERQVQVLSMDPFRSIVHGGAYEVRSNMVHKIPLTDVDHVLTTINDMAKRAIQ